MKLWERRLPDANREAGLLLIALLILSNGLTVVTLATGHTGSPVWTVIALVTAGLAVSHLLLRHGGRHGDPLILPLATMLSAVGLTMILRLKPELLLSQTIWLLIGLLLFLLVARCGHRLEELARYKYLCGVTGVGLLLITALFGVDIGGNKNWLTIGFIRFQPSEFAKLFLMIFLAAYLSERREILTFSGRRYGFFLLPPLRFAAPLLSAIGLSLLLLVVEKDLGAALLYFGSTIIIIYLACGRFSYVVLAAALFLGGAAVCYLLFSHVQTRVDIWLHPWSDPNGKAYQIVQSLFALGSGGLLGSGVGWGYPALIPEVHTDFIFAAIGEELGFAGGAAIMLSYMLLMQRGFRAAMKAPNDFVALLAGGLTSFLALQVFLIIAGVTKFMPLTGITLPFVSYGGSSITANFLLLGILFAVSEMGQKHE